MKICRKCTTELYFCLVNVTLQFNYPLYFRKELIKELLKSTHSLILIERLHKNQYFFPVEQIKMSTSQGEKHYCRINVD